jgi:tetratricopeptide (TPR) repeat protein
MKGVFSWVVRSAITIVAIFLAVQSICFARADWVATHPPPEGIYRALEIAPSDSALLLRVALARSQSGDMSSSADQWLQRAAEANPLSPDIRMALGLREEFRGHTSQAERDFVRATEVDRTFKPVWTLINFYARSGQPDKTWPLIQRAFTLDPLAFSPTPIFDLCWNQGSDPARIAALLPEQGAIPVQYLFYLLATKRTDEAIRFWPKALAAVGTNNTSSDAQALIQYPDFLIGANRVTEAVRGWNDLVDRKIIASGRLDPASGASIADPDFSFPFLDHSFGWRPGTASGWFLIKGTAALHFEFDGNEPESSSVLLTTLAPLTPAQVYRLVWNADGTRLNATNDPGFELRITQEPGETPTPCIPLLKAGGPGECAFTSGPSAHYARLELRYGRALGAVRAQGTLQLSRVKLDFGS